MEKGERRKKVKKIEMSIVSMLLNFKEVHGCTLHPRTSEPCTSCSDQKKCKHYGWERDYIHSNNTAAVTSERRDRRTAAQERRNVEEVTTPAYPCEPMDFACPDRDKCHEGDFCQWKPET